VGVQMENEALPKHRKREMRPARTLLSRSLPNPNDCRPADTRDGAPCGFCYALSGFALTLHPLKLSCEIGKYPAYLFFNIRLLPKEIFGISCSRNSRYCSS
jgi:hypothetical protein